MPGRINPVHHHPTLHPDTVTELEASGLPLFPFCFFFFASVFPSVRWGFFPPNSVFDLLGGSNLVNVTHVVCSIVSDPLRPHDHQAPPSVEFSRREYWSRLPFLLQGIFPTQKFNPYLLVSLALAGGFFTTSAKTLPYLDPALKNILIQKKFTELQSHLFSPRQWLFSHRVRPQRTPVPLSLLSVWFQTPACVTVTR